MWELLAGGVVGLLLGCAVSALTFFGLVKIPARYLFGVTTTLITFLAAGLAAQSIVFLQQGGLVTALDRTRLGHVRNPPRQQSHWSCAAHTRWLHRSTFRNAGRRIRDHIARHLFSHTITRPDQTWAAKRSGCVKSWPLQTKMHEYVLTKWDSQSILHSPDIGARQ